jgi:hypothetical protein
VTAAAGTCLLQTGRVWERALWPLAARPRHLWRRVSNWGDSGRYCSTGGCCGLCRGAEQHCVVCGAVIVQYC